MLVSSFVLRRILFNDHVHSLFMFCILNLHVLLIDFSALQIIRWLIMSQVTGASLSLTSTGPFNVMIYDSFN